MSRIYSKQPRTSGNLLTIDLLKNMGMWIVIFVTISEFAGG
jgi:hypothetical protein